MVYVQRVRSTMKQGCDLALGKHTVLFGHNGAGKSTVVQSIQLALLGTVSDLEGRDQVKKHTTLARLFPQTAPMEVVVTMSDGTDFSWSMERAAKEGSFKEPVESRPYTVAFPIQHITSVLRGDTSVVAKWLEQRIAGDGAVADLLRRASPSDRPALQAFLKANLNSTDFLALAKKAKDEARKLKTDATKIEGTIDRLVVGVEPPMLDEERQAQEQRLAELASAPRGMSQADYDQLLSEARAVKASVDALTQEVATLATMPELPKNVDRAQKVLNLIHSNKECSPDGSCMVCSLGSAEQVENMRTLVQNAVDEALPQFRALQAQARKRQEQEQQLADKKRELDRYVTRLEQAVVVTDTQDERIQLVQLLARDDAARNAWRNADAERRSVVTKREKAEQLGKIAKTLEKLGQALLLERKATYLDVVNRYLLPEERMDFDLATGRVGLLRGDELHSTLSGAEWTRLLLALASAETDSSTPCILAPEDRAWDRDTLSAVMQALADSPYPVLLMSTVRPDDVPGWTILDVKEE